MSLLMEALRKAEEAKSKASPEEDSQSLPTAKAEQSEKPAQPEIEKEEASDSIAFSDSISDDVVHAESNDSDSSEEYEFYTSHSSSNPDAYSETIEEADFLISDNEIDSPKEASPKSFTEPPVEDEELEFQYAPSENKPVQSASNLVNEHRRRNVREDQNKASIDAVFKAKKATQSKKRRKLVTAAAIAILIPCGGILLWLYLYNNSSSQFQYPAISSSSTGFLEETSAASIQSLDSSSDATSTTPINEQSGINTSSSQDVNIDDISTLSIAETETETETLIDEQELTSTFETQNSTVEAEIASEQNTTLTTQNQRPTISFTRKVTSENQIDPLLTSAFSDYQLGNYEQALTKYQQVLNSSSNDRNALLGLAAVYIKQGDTFSARNLYSTLLRLNPKDPIARTGLLNLTYAGDSAQQEAQLKSLLALHPNVAPLDFALGNLMASQNRWNEAQSAYFNASLKAKENSSAPISPDYPFNLAVSLEQLNQLPLAYTYYLEAKELSRFSTPSFDSTSLNSRLQYLEQRLP